MKSKIEDAKFVNPIFFSVNIFSIEILCNSSESSDAKDEGEVLLIEYPMSRMIERPKVLLLEYPKVLLLEYCNVDSVDEELPVNNATDLKEHSIISSSMAHDESQTSTECNADETCRMIESQSMSSDSNRREQLDEFERFLMQISGSSF